MHSRDPAFAALHRLMNFAQYVRVRRMIFDIALEPKQTFWNLTLNLLLEAAAVEWSKVFGSTRTEKTHWTKVIPANQHHATRATLHAHLGLTADEWKQVRDSGCRLPQPAGLAP